MRTRFLPLAVALFLFGLYAPATPVYAAYPDHPIRLVIPYVAGATGDITARMLAEELEKVLGVKVIPENKPGASTILGVETVIRAKRDGYTLVYAGPTATTLMPITSPNVVHYDPVKDLEPLGLHYYFPQTISVRADAPWKTFTQLADYVKQNPGKVRVSTIGVGSSPHFILEMIQAITGTQFTHVPFEGGESTVTAVMGGHVEATCDGVAKIKPHMEAGKLKMLLITNKMPAYPDVPTITELGYKQKLFTTYFAVYAAGGIPDEARKVLVPALEKALKATKAKVEAMGSLPEYLSPDQMRTKRDEEYKVMYEIATRLGLRKN